MKTLQQAEELIPAQAELAKNPDDPDKLFAVARLLGKQQLYGGAACYARQALGIRPDNAVFHRELEEYLFRLGRADEALYHLRRAMTLNPRDGEARRRLGAALCQMKDIALSVAVLRRATQGRVSRGKSLAFLANALYEKGEFRRALAAARQAVGLRGGRQARLILARALCQVGEFEAAIEQAKLGSRGSRAEDLGTLAIVLGRAGRLNEAMAVTRRALGKAPEDPHLHFLLAWGMLAAGDYENGWRECEWRLKKLPSGLDHGKFPARLNERMWNGEDLGGKTILVHGEQGFGDNIQFIRCVRPLHRLGARVILLAAKELVGLFSEMPEVAHCAPYGELLPRYDYHIVVGSLPRIFTKAVGSIPDEVPYLQVAERGDGFFRPRHPSRLNVGIIWAGTKLGPDDSRAAGIEALAPLFAHAKADFYSLQIGLRSGEVKPYLGGNVFDASHWIKDFTDSAALLKKLDLLVSVDSGPAHLAGSLGLKVFTLLPFAADWRWLENRPGSPHYSRTPWYPTMTLFRQTTCRNWRSVVTRLIKAIRAEAEAKAATLNGLRPKPADLNGRDNVPPGECHRPLIKPSLISDISCGGNGHAPSAAESATRPEAVIGVAELAEGNGSMPGGGHRNGRVSSGPV